MTDCEIHPRTGVKCCTDVIPHGWAADGQRFKLTPLTSKHIFKLDALCRLFFFTEFSQPVLPDLPYQSIKGIFHSLQCKTQLPSVLRNAQRSSPRRGNGPNWISGTKWQVFHIVLAQLILTFSLDYFWEFGIIKFLHQLFTKKPGYSMGCNFLQHLHTWKTF